MGTVQEPGSSIPPCSPLDGSNMEGSSLPSTQPCRQIGLPGSQDTITAHTLSYELLHRSSHKHGTEMCLLLCICRDFTLHSRCGTARGHSRGCRQCPGTQTRRSEPALPAGLVASEMQWPKVGKWRFAAANDVLHSGTRRGCRLWVDLPQW